MLLRIGKRTVNMDLVQFICDHGYEIELVFGQGYTTSFRGDEADALRAWLTERSVDLLKAQAVAA